MFMKGRTTRAVCILLSAFLVLSVMPMADYSGLLSAFTVKAKADNYGDFDFDYYWENGEQMIRIFSYNGDAANVTVPEKIFNYPVGDIGDNAFSGNDAVEKVILPESVRYIENEAFRDCANLSEINLPGSLQSIGDRAFSGCSGLFAGKTITLDGSIGNIGCEAFRDTAVQNVVIDASSLSVDDRLDMGDTVFACCPAIESVTITGTGNEYNRLDIQCNLFENSGNNCTVSVIGSVFLGDRVFAGADIDTLTLSDDVEMGNCVFEQSTVKSVVASDNVYIRNEAFRDCDSLVSVEAFDNIEINEAFSGCDSLRTIEIYTTKKYEEVDGEERAVKNYIRDRSLSEIPELETLTIRNSEINGEVIRDSGNNLALTISDCEVQDNSFRENCGITSLNAERVYLYRESFRDCTNLSDISLREVELEERVFENIAWYNAQPDNAPVCIDITDENDNTQKVMIGFKGYAEEGVVNLSDDINIIKNYAFNDRYVERLVIPASVNQIEYGALFFLEGLSEIEVDAENERYYSYDGMLFLRDVYVDGDFSMETNTLICCPKEKAGVAEIPADTTFINSEVFLYRNRITAYSVNGEDSSYSVIDGVLFWHEYHPAAYDSEEMTDINWLCSYPGEKDGEQYVIPEGTQGIFDYAFGDKNNVGEIVIPASVSYITDTAFYKGFYQLSLDEDNEYYSLEDNVLFSGMGSELVWYGEYDGRTQYNIPEGTQVVHSYAFFEAGITEVTFPTSLRTICANAFEGCYQLGEVVINNTTPGPVIIDREAFIRCGAIGLVEITGQAEICERAFSESFTENGSADIILSGEINVYENAFSNASFWNDEEQHFEYSIRNVTLSDGVVVGDGAFRNSVYGEVTVSENVILSWDCFSNGTITALSVADTNPEDGIIEIDHAFRYNQKRVEIDGEYQDAPSIENVSISGFFHISERAFENSICGKVDIVGCDEEHYSEIDNSAFVDNGIQKLTISSYVNVWAEAFARCNELTTLEISNNVNIAECVFVDCRALETVTLSENITVGNSAFANDRISSVTISDSDCEERSYIGWNAFMNNCYWDEENECQVYTILSIEISGNVTVDNRAFQNSAGGTVVISGAKDGRAEIGECVFENGSVTDFLAENGVLFGTFDEEGNFINAMRVIDNNFSLETITLRNNVTLSHCTFDNCKGVKKVILGNNVDLGMWSFANCPELETVVMYGNVIFDEEGAFQDCGEISEVVIPYGTQLIAENTFENMRSLNKVFIPASVTEIRHNAFRGSNDIQYVFYEGTEEQFYEIVNREGNEILFDTERCQVIFEHTHNADEMTFVEKLCDADCEWNEWNLYTCTTAPCKMNIAMPTEGEIPGHSYAVAPSCSTRQPCTVCGYYSDFDPSNHDGEMEIRNAEAANCACEGYSGDKYCLACGELAEEGEATPIDPKNHETDSTHKDEATIIPATCVSKGYDGDNLCDGCDAKMSDGEETEINPDNHVGGTETANAVAATCISAGKEADIVCSSCRTVLTEGKVTEINPNNHMSDPVQGDDTPATCTEAGKYGDFYCPDCKKVFFAGKELSKLGHSFTNYVSNNDATCTADGTKTAKCDRCDVTDTVTDEGSKLGHNYEAVVTAPTCVAEGYTTYTCSRCPDSYVADTVAKLGHNFDESIEADVTIVPATCTKDGTKTVKCSRCDATDVTVLTKLGHNHESEVIAPTCTEQGYTYVYCTRCSDCYKTGYVDATGHSYKAQYKADKQHEYTCENCGDTYTEDCNFYLMGNKPATCKQAGEKDYCCSVCKYVYADHFDKLPHTEVTDPAAEPTCTEDGKTEGSHCSVCKTVLVEQKTIPAKGHNVVIDEAVAPKCNLTGKTEGSHCSVCNTVLKAQETVAKLGHDYKSEVIAPTCTEQGYTHVYCTRCSDQYKTDYVDATGHSYKAQYKADKQHEYTCENCGDTYTEDCNFYLMGNKPATCKQAGEKDYCCSVCKYVYADHFDKLPHTEVTDPAAEPTCTEDGKTEGSHCSVCKTVLVEQKTIPAKGHNEVTDAFVLPTCTVEGKTEGSHCSVCNAVLKAQDTIPAPGHTYLYYVIAPTCTAAGYTRNVCTRCADACISDEVAAKGHTVVTDAAVAATCTEDGKTEGSHCSVCNTVLVEQKTVPAMGHKEETIPAVEATYTATGLTAGVKCSVCGKVLVEQKVVEKLIPQNISTANVTENSDGIAVATVAANAAEITSAYPGFTVDSENGSLATGMKIVRADGTELIIAVLGDVDGDGNVTVADARLALRQAIKLESYKVGSAQFIACNVDSEGDVTVADARLILRAAIKLDSASDWKTGK